MTAVKKIEKKVYTKIKDLQPGMKVWLKGTFGKKQGHTRKNDPYLNVWIKDFSGTASQMVWNNLDLYPVVQEIEDGVKVEVEANVTQVGQYTNIEILQIKELFELDDQIINLESLTNELREAIAGIKDKELKVLVTRVFSRVDVKKAFFSAPASLLAYGYEGSLLLHTVRLTRLVKAIIPIYSGELLDESGVDLDEDLLMTAAILHDVGKVRAFQKSGAKVEKTTEGELFEDSYITSKILLESMAGLNFSQDRLMLLEHAISSAKGEQRHGALTIPRTKEAHALAMLDALDSGLANFEYLYREMEGDDFARFVNKQYYIGNMG